MKIALIGNQNSGKTTLFNCLTGMNQKSGNWPGVTVEKKVGVITGTKHELVDLPGIYSFGPYTMEEKISQEFVLNEEIDLIINVVDACNLERGLYLTTQLLELDCDVIVVLNMIDVATKKGIKIDEVDLEIQLGVNICKVSAKREVGIKRLLKLIQNKNAHYKNKIFDKYIEENITSIENKYLEHEKNKRFIAIRLLEEKETRKNIDVISYVKNIEEKYEIEVNEAIATQRYEYLDRIIDKTVTYTKNIKTFSNKIDKIFLNRYLSFPIFILVIFFIFYISVGIIGNYANSRLELLIKSFKSILETLLISLNVSDWISSLVLDGMLAGISTVLSFVPQLIMLFLCVSVLESSGYMSRVALMFDSFFRKIGLSGKSIIPFILGSGCSVSGIMASRIIEKDEERKLTVMLTPFIPCSAKLPIIAMFSGCFFGKYASIVSTIFYFLSVAIIVISAYFISKKQIKNITYIAELPEYKLPSIKYIFVDVAGKVISFLKRIGSTILICSIAIWFLLSFSTTFEYNVELENSILASIGKKLSWIFYPIIGTNSWQATVSIMQGIVAKEQVISSMSVISGISGDSAKMFLKDGIFGFFTPFSACAFISFNLFSIPCINAIIAMKRELDSNIKFLKVLLFQTFIAYIISIIIYQVGKVI